jgi:hypothetical protein
VKALEHLHRHGHRHAFLERVPVHHVVAVEGVRQLVTEGGAIGLHETDGVLGGRVRAGDALVGERAVLDDLDGVGSRRRTADFFEDREERFHVRPKMNELGRGPGIVG